MTQLTHLTRHVRAVALTSAKHLAMAGVLMAAAVAAMAQSATAVGTWQTIDDHTGQPKALIQITRDGSGNLTGKIIKGLGPDDNPQRRCTACTDERKDQLIKGMTIIKAMKK